MKRHKSLIPLSHDHHHGLVLASSIKKSAPSFDNSPEVLTKNAAKTRQVYKDELTIHFKHEEEILFPLVIGIDEQLDILIEKIIKEHKTLYAMLPDKESKTLADDLDAFGIFLENHIRIEERILFPLIEEVVPKDILENLIGKIIAVKDKCSH